MESGSPSLPPGSHLRELMSVVQTARRKVHLLRAGKVDPALLLAARAQLLGAMEDYAAELSRCGLPTPPGLRDELRLHRAIPGIAKEAPLPYRHGPRTRPDRGGPA